VLRDELGNRGRVPLASAGWLEASRFEVFADGGEGLVLGAQLGGERGGFP